MDKGTRVEVVDGPSDVGVTGVVFWSGPDKFNPGQTRVGLKGDDGETYWVDADHIEESERVMELDIDPNAPKPERGTRVAWKDGEGTVFWYGKSKYGDGMRVGVETDEGDKLWLDGRQVKVIEGGEAGGGERERRPSGGAHSDSGGSTRDPGPEPAHLADAPPIDDDAGSGGSEPPPDFDEVPPHDDHDAPPEDDEGDYPEGYDPEDIPI